MSMRKSKVLPKQQSLLQKVFLSTLFVMLSSGLYAQRYRPEYDGGNPTPWWLSTLTLIIILIYLWVNKKVKMSGKLYLPLSVVLVVVYTMARLYEWIFYLLVAIAALGFFKWGDKIEEFITKWKNK